MNEMQWTSEFSQHLATTVFSLEVRSRGRNGYRGQVDRGLAYDLKPSADVLGNAA